MATIHMNVDEAKSVSTSIANSKEKLSNEVLDLHSQINNLVGSSWMAPSADQFRAEYEAWAGKIRQLMEELATLQERLNQEIAQYEETGAKLV